MEKIPTFVSIHSFNKFRIMRKGLFLTAVSMIMLFATVTSVYAQSDNNKEYRATLETMMNLSGA